MLLRASTLAGIEAGEIDLQFRRWKRPTVRAGGTLTTPVGVLAIDAVDAIDLADISDDEAKRSGAADVAAVRAELMRRDGVDHRIAFHLAGPDPRIALRQHADLSAADLDALRRRLDRLDKASTHGRWTRETLELIRAQPGVRAPDLAAQVGRERDPFKVDVRKLKALGLTESLEVGYRLSPRGAALLDLWEA